MEYNTIKKLIKNAFESDDEEDMSPDIEMKTIRDRMKGQERRANTTYLKICDIRRTLAIKNIRRSTIRSMSVGQIDGIRRSAPEGFSTANIRLAINVQWTRLAEFFEQRKNLDSFVRYMIVWLEKNERKTLELLLNTTLTENKELIQLLQKEMVKDVRSAWLRRMVSEAEVDAAINALKDRRYFSEWSQNFKFGGGVGGVRDNSGRTSIWMIRQYESYEDKLNAKMFKENEDVDVPDESERVPEMINAPGEIEVSMKSTKKQGEEEKKRTTDNMADNGIAENGKIEMDVKSTHGIVKKREKERRQTRSPRTRHSSQKEIPKPTVVATKFGRKKKECSKEKNKQECKTVRQMMKGVLKQNKEWHQKNEEKRTSKDTKSLSKEKDSHTKVYQNTRKKAAERKAKNQ